MTLEQLEDAFPELRFTPRPIPRDVGLAFERSEAIRAEHFPASLRPEEQIAAAQTWLDGRCALDQDGEKTGVIGQIIDEDLRAFFDLRKWCNDENRRRLRHGRYLTALANYIGKPLEFASGFELRTAIDDLKIAREVMIAHGRDEIELVCDGPIELVHGSVGPLQLAKMKAGADQFIKAIRNGKLPNPALPKSIRNRQKNA